MGDDAMRKIFAVCLLLSFGHLYADGDVLWVASAHASKQGKTASSLQEVVPSMEKNFGLKSLQLEKEKKWDITVGGEGTFQFENGYTLRIGCESMDASRYVFSVVMSDAQGSLLTTKIEAAKRVPLILAGPEEKGSRQMFVVLVR